MSPMIRRLALNYSNHVANRKGTANGFRVFLCATLALLANGEHAVQEYDAERFATEIVQYLTQDMTAHADDTGRSHSVIVNGSPLTLRTVR
jgi:hypothetical protein